MVRVCDLVLVVCMLGMNRRLAVVVEPRMLVVVVTIAVVVILIWVAWIGLALVDAVVRL